MFTMLLKIICMRLGQCPFVANCTRDVRYVPSLWIGLEAISFDSRVYIGSDKLTESLRPITDETRVSAAADEWKHPITCDVFICIHLDGANANVCASRSLWCFPQYE